MRVFLILLLTSNIYLSAFSQTGNHVITSGSGMFYFEDQVLKIEEVKFLWNGYAGQAYIESDYDGSLKFAKGNFMINRNGEYLTTPNSDSVDSQNLGFKISKDRYLVFSWRQLPGLSTKSSIIKYVLEKKEGVLKISEGEELFSDDYIYSLAVIGDTVNGNWLLVRSGLNKITKFFFKDSIDRLIQETNILAEIVNVETYLVGDLSITASPSGNFIAVQTTSRDNKNTTNKELWEEHWSMLLYKIDKISGDLLYHSTIIDTTVIGTGFTYTPCEFSSNDLYLYYSKGLSLSGNTRIVTNIQRYDIRSKISVGLITFANQSYAGLELRSPSGMKLFNDGNIYLFRFNNSQSNRYKYILDAIQFPNLSASEYQFYDFVSEPIFFNYAVSFGYSKYNYIRVKPQYRYDCQAHVTFLDKCDYALPNTTVTYFSEDVAGSGVLIPRGQNPSITYTKNGDYLCKVILKSHEGTYKEIHYDTLKVRIPPKPVASFPAADTVICAYVTLKFINQSTSDTVNATNGEKWVWTFGDGTTQTVLSPESTSPVSHIYKKPGTYTVSLFYSNGFCDSTLVKNQYITVVDAPAPGFSVDKVQGCSPFTVKVSDTVTLNTVKKEYLIGNQLAFKDTLPFNGTWDEYYSFPFGEGRDGAFTFSIPGSYWVTQKLYGYTGCITQLDSVQIFVSPGFTISDTLHVNTATYADVLPNEVKSAGYQTVTIDWDCREDVAVKYQVRRNNQKVGEKSAMCIYGQSQFVDTLKNNDLASFVYTISGLDSCGTATQVGRIGQPIYLTGQVKGNNELSILQFNNYLDWNVGVNEINYTIQTENDGMWQSLASRNNNTDYTDKQFLDLANQGVKLEKCYRIVGESANQKTISNILCLPYTPVLFIPTAITPNADGLNDVFKPITFGIESYNVQIYNRWGQLVADFDETSPGWEAKEMPQGAYMVIIRAKGNDNNWYTENSTVTVVR